MKLSGVHQGTCYHATLADHNGPLFSVTCLELEAGWYGAVVSIYSPLLLAARLRALLITRHLAESLGSRGHLQSQVIPYILVAVPLDNPTLLHSLSVLSFSNFKPKASVLVVEVEIQPPLAPSHVGLTFFFVMLGQCLFYFVPY